MTEPTKQNHWHDLARSLGATPAPEVEQPPAAASAKQPEEVRPPAAIPSPRREPVARPPRPPANWDEVASTLGLAPPPSKPSPAESPKPPAEPMMDDIGPIADVSEQTADLPEAPPESSEPRHGRRRRKWRDRPRRFGEEERQSEEEIPTDVEPIEGPILELPEEEEAVAEPSAEGAEGEPESREEGEPRRRRRRGDRRRRKRSRAPTSDAPSVRIEAEEGEPQATRAEPDAEPDAELSEVVAEESEEDPRSGKTVLRGIPTWQEAIGLIVSTNMEARAKRPGGPPRSHHGGRGDRENRGPRKDSSRRRR